MRRYLPDLFLITCGLVLGGIICWINADIRFAYFFCPVAIIYGLLVPFYWERDRL